MLSKLSKRVRWLLRMCDLFAVSQFIKYKGESDYKTATGGLFSLMILIIFAVLFTNVAIKTINKKIINWTSETTNDLEPSSTNITVSPAPFLFSVGIMYLDLNDPSFRYFDFQLTERTWTGQYQISNRSVGLVQCTEKHFGTTETLRESFHKINASRWLCPPLHSQFLLSGKFTSPQLTFVEIVVKKCDPLLDPSRPCANDTKMKELQIQMGQFMLTQYFINPLINPGKEIYLDYYLEDRNFIAFTSKLGTYSNAYIEDFVVSTDESILPFAIPKEETGVIIPDLCQNINFEVTSDILAMLFFYKSSSSTTYNRSFYKLDEFFSYVGGLVGVIMGGMLILQSYNEISFEFNLAYDLYRKQQDHVLYRFNFLYYIILFFHSIIRKFSKKCLDWQLIEKFQEVKDEMEKELDISLILSRILFLERSIQILFDSGQFQAMHLAQKPTKQQIKILRNYYYIKKRLKTSKNNHQNIALNQSQSSLKKISDASIESDQYIDQDEELSDIEDIDENMKNNFETMIKDFQHSVIIGNKISLKISKQILWKDVHIQMERYSHQQQSIHQKQNTKTQRQETHIEPIKIRPKEEEEEHKELDLNNFQFITFHEQIKE